VCQQRKKGSWVEKKKNSQIRLGKVLFLKARCRASQTQREEREKKKREIVCGKLQVKQDEPKGSPVFTERGVFKDTPVSLSARKNVSDTKSGP